jgi:hypothetical protein
VWHGYVRDTSGNFTTFDVSAAGHGQYQGTFPAGINTAGVVAGSYQDSANVDHGFVRDVAGNIATFDGPEGGRDRRLAIQ